MFSSFRSPHRLVSAFLIGSSSLLAQTAPAGDALAKLVPEGTAVFVQAPSLQRLDAAIRRVMTAFEPEEAASFDIDTMLAGMELPGSPKEIDHSRPFAFCLVLPATAGTPPSPAFLVPAVSADALVRSITESGMPMTTKVENGYVTVSVSPEIQHAAAPAPIALGLPAGDVVARVDLERLVAHFRPMIDMGLGQMEMMMTSMPAQATGGIQVGPLMKIYVDCMRSIVESGETLDLVLRLEGNRMEVTSTLRAKEGSALASFASKEKTDTKALAPYLDPKAPMGFLIGLDSVAMVERLKPFIDATLAIYPEPMRTDFQKMMGSYDEMVAQMGSGMSCTGSLAADGMRVAVYLRPRDPHKLLAAYRTMLTSMPSLKVDAPKEENVDGLSVTRMRIQVDAKAYAGALAKAANTGQKRNGNQGVDPAAEVQAMLEKLYGKDGLTLTLATKGGVTAVVVGGDDAFQRASLARLSTPGQVPAGVARGLDQVGNLNPCFLVQYDFGRMMNSMEGLMGPAFSQSGLEFPDLSASITSWLGVDGRVWKSAMSADLNELGAFTKAMKASAMKAARARNGSAPAGELEPKDERED